MRQRSEFEFEYYLRTGRRQSDQIERKFNPWHDPEDGRFTFAGQGRNFGGGAGRANGQSTQRSPGAGPKTPSASARTGRNSPQNPNPISGAAREVGATHPSLRASPAALKAAATKLKSNESRLIDVGGIKVVQFGPGVELVPVAVASVEEFSAATAQGSKMFDLDAVITGPQFNVISGSQGLNGQVVVNGRTFGTSAPDMYYIATVEGANGQTRLTFGKGDPPPGRVATAFGGAVPLLIRGQAVSGYNKAWQPYLENVGTGKNIFAYNSMANTAALFIQPDGASGHSLQSVRDYISAAGYDYAVLFDGSGSTSLRYLGKAVVNPEVVREPFIPLGIGIKVKGR